MRKLIFTLLLMTLGTFAFAQKEYVHVQAWLELTSYSSGEHYDEVRLSGAIPSTMKIEYDVDDKTTIGDVINMLAKEGFVVEQMQMSYSNHFMESFLLSRNSSNTSSGRTRQTLWSRPCRC